MAGTKARSARGEIIDFDILSIKAKLESASKPVKVKEREDYIAQKSRRRRSKKADKKDEKKEQTEETKSKEEKKDES